MIYIWVILTMFKNFFICALVYFFTALPSALSAQVSSETANQENNKGVGQAACKADDTFGTIVNNAMGNTGGELISVMFTISALIGVIGVGLGIKSLIASSSDSRANPVASGLMKIFAGSLLISIPAAMTIIGETFFKEEANKSTTDLLKGDIKRDLCKPADNLTQMYTNFVIDAADPLSKLAYFAALIIGIYLILSAIQRLMESSNPNSQYNNKTGQQIARLAVGGLFVNIQALVTVLSDTLFSGQGNYEALKFQGGSVLDHKVTYPEGFDYFCNAASDYIFWGLVPFGLFAVISGLRSIYMSMEGGQQASIGGGFVRIVAGIILVNMKPFAIAVMNTMAPSAKIIAESCGA